MAEGRLLLTFAEAGERIGVCDRTVRGHVDRGELKCVAFGKGTQRRKRFIHPDDLDDFIALKRQESAACPSIAPRARRITTTTSSSGSGGFLELLAAEKSQKPGTTSNASRKKPSVPPKTKVPLQLVK